jgi:hypothetical protein
MTSMQQGSKGESRGIRRVVTGVDEAGRPAIASDEIIEPIRPSLFPGNEFYRLWGLDRIAHVPNHGRAPEGTSYFPPAGGCRFEFFTLAGRSGPRATIEIDRATGLAELDAKLPGLMDHQDPDGSGMHVTATVDFVIVIAGSVVLDLGHGTTVTLHAGDTVVQNGTRHRWSNRDVTPAVLALLIVGARPR